MTSKASIGVNLRVTGHCNQGGRRYMEDVFTVAYQQTEDDKDLEYAFFGIFDGHGGREAALFAKEHLMDSITKLKHFWADEDDQVLKAIKDGFLSTQQAMWKDQKNWNPTSSGLPSTAGTTASVCFIKRGKLFIGHCGDSGIILGERDPHDPERWRARPLTTDHKPESKLELSRIHQAGGKVVNKSGVPRVVWYRPKSDHQGPVRRSTTIEEVPFLAVARALGDLWSYNAKCDAFVVSPEPDLHVYDLNTVKDKCLILATDGAWNVLSPDVAVNVVYETERNNEKHMISSVSDSVWINPSKKLVDLAINRWTMCNLRADNTSIVTVMLDPPGPPRAQVLQRMHGSGPKSANSPPVLPPKPNNGVAIISRFPNSKKDDEKLGKNLVSQEPGQKPKQPTVTRIIHDSLKNNPSKLAVIAPQIESNPGERKPRNLITETISQALLNSPGEKSPSPPPLPVRPPNLKKYGQKSKPLPPLPAHSPHLPKCDEKDSAIPVKRVRRSILTAEYSSDSENQPEKVTCSQFNKKHSLKSRTSSRKSEPLVVTKVVKGQQESIENAASSTPDRILRPRNAKESPIVARNSSAKPNTRSSSSKFSSSVIHLGKKRDHLFDISGGMKRKRRTIDVMVPSSKISKTKLHAFHKK